MNPVSPFDIKSSQLDLLVCLLGTTDLAQLETAVAARFKVVESPTDLIENMMLDLSLLEDARALNLPATLSLLLRYGIRIVALQHSDYDYQTLAEAHQLIFNLTTKTMANRRRMALTQPIPTIEAPPPKTMVIDKPVRAGQRIYAQNSDLIILSMVSTGAEVLADGNIHIYNTFRGRALAGAKGDKNARLFIHKMEGELVSIAGTYLTFEHDLPDSLRGKVLCIYLNDDRLVIEAV
jgi:septum site-determining protein MinC